MFIKSSQKKNKNKKRSDPEIFDCHLFLLNPFSTSAPFTDKAGSWFLLAKCLKNTCGSVTF